MTTERGVIMAKRKMRAAGFWPRHALQAATRVLPGATRDRYRQEFVAELYGLARTRQLRHAAGVLSRSWALRPRSTPHPKQPPPTWNSCSRVSDGRCSAG